MKSSTIGWKKHKPEEIEMSDRKDNKPNRLIIKTALSKRLRKQQEDQDPKNKQPTKQDDPQKNLFVKVASKPNPYQPVKPKNTSNNLIQVIRERVMCSKRAVVATGFIIGLILLAAGVSAGIVFTVIKTDNSSSSDSSNLNLAVGTATELPMSTIVTGSQSGSPCLSSTYTSINDPSRNYNYTGSQGTCDDGYPFANANGGAWIRFEGSGGTQIPTWSIDINHCGGYLGIWSNDTLPTVPGVPKNITLCSSTLAGICIVVFDGAAVYCTGSYYVYFLPPAYICKSRYCTV